MTAPISTVAQIQIAPHQLELWKSGALAAHWAEHYPFLFDDLDLALTRTQNSSHFVEWLGAIILHHTTGFHALVEKPFTGTPRFHRWWPVVALGRSTLAARSRSTHPISYLLFPIS
jgi:hypothetical protein